MIDREMDLLEKIIRKIISAFAYVGMAMLVIMMFLGASDVIGRYFLNKPIAGAQETSEILLAGAVFFGWAYSLFKGRHVAIDTCVSRLSTRVKAKIDFVTSLIGLIVFALMAWQGAERAITSWKAGVLINVLFIPVFPFHFFVSVGALLLCLELIIQIRHFYARSKKRS